MTLSVKSVFITGCSRGIGLELVKQFLVLPNKPNHIFATCRNVEKAEELKELAKLNSSVHVKDFDVLDYASYPKVVSWVEEKLGGDGLNMLINNAAIIDRSSIDTVTRDAMISSYESNTIAPLLLSKAFIPLLHKAALNEGGDDGKMSCSKASIINVTTRMGSIDDNGSGGHYPYRASKAALNMISKSLSVDLKPKGILVGVVHPGWVQTEMGGPNALINTETSVKAILKVISTLNQADTGFFKSFDGTTIPW